MGKREYDERVDGVGQLNKNTSYFRIGLYKYSREYGHENFCDVHMTWPTPSRRYPNLESRDGKKLTTLPATTLPANHKAWFSGPNDSILKINRLERTRREMEEYDRHRDVVHDLDITEGGQAYVVPVGNWPQTKQAVIVDSKKVHVWLFGPLLLDNQPYGSLFFELSGPFRRDMVFRPLLLRASRYHEGKKAFIAPFKADPADAGLTSEQSEERYLREGGSSADYWNNLVVDTYNHRVKGTNPVHLSPDAKRWEWTVESYARNVTGLKAMRRSG